MKLWPGFTPQDVSKSKQLPATAPGSAKFGDVFGDRAGAPVDGGGGDDGGGPGRDHLAHVARLDAPQAPTRSP